MASVVLLRFSLVTSLISSVLGTRNVSPINTENSYSEFVRGNWGRVFVREVRNCYEASSESHVVSTPCNVTELRQIWRYNENKQIVNFYYRLCLTPVNLDGRDARVFLDVCTGQGAQKWTVTSQSLNDFTIQSSALELCLDVNGYAVRRTEIVQLAGCEPHFDDAARISDQYLQFEVTYTQIRISTADAIISQGESAKLSCQLQNTPKAPDYILWTNGVVQIEEFTTKSGYSISTGIFTNNSMLSILTIERVAAPESWTCLFTVDRNNFSAVSEVDMPDISCDGTAGENSMTASMKCCYYGKYEPTKIYWQRHGKTVKETARIYQITANSFSNRSQCTTIHFPKTSSRITFNVYYQTPHNTISETITSGPMALLTTTSPTSTTNVKTTFPSYRVINDVAQNSSKSNLTDKAMEEALKNSGKNIGLCCLLFFIVLFDSVVT